MRFRLPSPVCVKKEAIQCNQCVSLAQPQCATENALLNEKLIGAFLSRYPFPNGVVEEEIPSAAPVLLSVNTEDEWTALLPEKRLNFEAKIRTLSLNKA